MWLGGFKNAEVSFFFTTVFPFLMIPFCVGDLSSFIELNVDSIHSWQIIGRSFISQISYNNFISLILGTLLFYEMRSVERLVGSNNYLGLIALSTCAATLILPLILFLQEQFQYLIPSKFAMGPTSALFSALTYFFLNMPNLLEIVLFNKFVILANHCIYFLTFAFLISLGTTALLPASIGVITTLTLVALDLQPSAIPLPSPISSIVSTFANILLPPPLTAAQRQTRGLRPPQNYPMGKTFRLNLPLAFPADFVTMKEQNPESPLVAEKSSNIETTSSTNTTNNVDRETKTKLDFLMAMGFTSERALHALNQGKNDLSEAIVYLTK